MSENFADEEHTEEDGLTYGKGIGFEMFLGSRPDDVRDTSVCKSPLMFPIVPHHIIKLGLCTY